MRVYLDNSASTLVAPEVIAAMMPYLSEDFGNAQSVHSFGQRAKAAVEAARRHVAALLNAKPTEIVFVSGGTEADNLAIAGVADGYRDRGGHIITTTIEHPAVLATCDSLQRKGFRITYLPVSSSGLVSAEAVRTSISEDTVLVSVMHANNETGTLQPIEEIAQVVAEARKLGNSDLRFHTDAVQSTGKTPVDVKQLGVDLLSLSGHKIHAPKGVGALYIRKGVRPGRLFFGGHQERDRRPGTENVPGIVALGRAAELIRTNMDVRVGRMRELRDYFEQLVVERIEGVRVNGDPIRRVPNVTNLSFRDVDGEALLIALDLKGIAVSTGSACASGSVEPSHVLTALGLTREEVRGSLRISLSAYTTRNEIDYAVNALQETIERFRRMLPTEGSGIAEVLSRSRA